MTIKAKFAKTIRLFLMDADPDGRVVCELSNWTGKAYRIPRGSVKDCSDREDLKGTAVYFLFGKPETSVSRPKVYIGEAEDVYKRLVQHIAEKEFWNESVVFISKDENLNKAHIKYLESRLFENAVSSNRYEILNGNTPTKSSISESDQAEMEEFIEYVEMLINVLGFKVFEPLLGIPDSLGNLNAHNLYVKAARGANALGRRVNDGFVVLKGSEIATDIVASFPNGFKTLRDELLEIKTIQLMNDKLVFVEDYLFSSPSAAAAVVMGRSANGLVEWKDATGKDLKTIEANEISNQSKFLD
jgi:hypothetical protein